MPRGRLSNSAAPTSSSSFAICLLSADTATYKRVEAWLSDPLRATSRK